jgi:hypothetical protein
MKEQLWKLIIVTLPGEQIEVSYPDIEIARQTARDWLIKGWARGAFIEPVEEDEEE